MGNKHYLFKLAGVVLISAVALRADAEPLGISIGISVPETQGRGSPTPPVTVACLLISGSTTNCLLISGSTTNALLVH